MSVESQRAEGIGRLARAIANEMNSTIQPDDPEPVRVSAEMAPIRAAAEAAWDVFVTTLAVAP